MSSWLMLSEIVWLAEASNRSALSLPTSVVPASGDSEVVELVFETIGSVLQAATLTTIADAKMPARAFLRRLTGLAIRVPLIAFTSMKGS